MNWTEEEYEEFIKMKNMLPPTNKSKPKKNKYSNRKTTVDGITFDSKKEADYYLKLKQQKADGEIKGFELQPEYELQPKFKKNDKTYRPINYIADFIIEHNDGTTEVVDIKGMEKEKFRIKKKLFEYKYKDLTLRVIK